MRTLIRMAATLELTSTHRRMVKARDGDAARPLSSIWIQRRACETRKMKKSWVGRFLAEYFWR